MAKSGSPAVAEEGEDGEADAVVDDEDDQQSLDEFEKFKRWLDQSNPTPASEAAPKTENPKTADPKGTTEAADADRILVENLNKLKFSSSTPTSNSQLPKIGRLLAYAWSFSSQRQCSHICQGSAALKRSQLLLMIAQKKAALMEQQIIELKKKQIQLLSLAMGGCSGHQLCTQNNTKTLNSTNIWVVMNIEFH